MNRGTLRKALDSNQEIELYTRIKWASQATRGLAYLHGCQVIHRDFKSNNLLLDRGWNCKVSGMWFFFFHFKTKTIITKK